MNRHPDVRLANSELVYQGRVFSVRKEELTLPSGLHQQLAVVDHPGAVAIAALDRDGSLLVVRQYRHAVGDWLLEVPAGRLESGEDPLAAAQRELEEETQHRAERWTELARFYPAPGFCSEQITVFLAEDLRPATGVVRAMDADEELECLRVAPRALVEDGPRDAKTWIAASLVLARRKPV